MWLAEFNYCDVNFKAIGLTEAAARRRVVAAFKMSAEYGKADKSERMDIDKLINVLELVTDGAWINNIRITKGLLKC